MAPQSDEAVVLRLTEYSETSQIASLFTARHGLLRLIAKGVRRSTKKRFAVGLDLLELGEVGFVPAHGSAQLGTLTEWVQRDAFAGLRRELLRLHGGLYAIELVAALTEEGDPHPGLFGALVGTLHGLAGPGPAAGHLPTFQNVLLREIGYAPNMEACAGCAGRIAPGAPVYFSAGVGGLLCRDCEPHQIEKRRLPRDLLETTPDSGDAQEWFELLDYHLTHVAGRRFKTARQVLTLLAREQTRRL